MMSSCLCSPQSATCVHVVDAAKQMQQMLPGERAQATGQSTVKAASDAAANAKAGGPKGFSASASPCASTTAGGKPPVKGM
jgi:hypothetical protein